MNKTDNIFNVDDENNIITGLVIAGELYNVRPNGVKCPQCAINEYCMKGLGNKVQFDCASVHLVKAI
uniref:Uncharacterized protein n=1 Tax=Geladintestivirus 4 TaxID=3233136 RepID=A0AAU8MKP6_9CAUD